MDVQQKRQSSGLPRSGPGEASGDAGVMYVAIGIRLDIMYAISALSQFPKCSKQIHMTAIKRVYKYLKGTKNCNLFYKRSRTNLCLSIDASWDSTQDARPFSGYILKLGGNTIAWMSIKQKKLVTLHAKLK